MAENLAYTTLINSLGPSNPIHTSNRHSLYDDNVLFEYEYVPSTTVSSTVSSSSRSFLSRSAPSSSSSSTSNSTSSFTTAVRRVLVLNDAILVCKASKDGLIILHELPWDTLTIEDLLPYSSSSFSGPLRYQLQHLNTTQVQCSIALVVTKNDPSTSSSSSPPPSPPIILYTPSYQEKSQWLSMVQNTLPSVVPIDRQMNKHWIHNIYTGTLFNACYSKNIDMMKALLPYVPNYQLSSSSSSSSDTKDTNTFDQFIRTSSGSSNSSSTDNKDGTGSSSSASIELSVNDLDNEGYAPIHLATLRGSQPIVSLLLEAGALIDLTDNENFDTSLHIACQYVFIDICSLLIVNGSNLENRNLLEQTPLSVILNKLLEITIQIDKAAEDGNDTETLVSLRTTEKNCIGIIELLVSYNCPLNESDSEGLYPLHRLALTHGDQLVRSFIRHGAQAANLALLNRPSIIKSMISSSSSSPSSSPYATVTDQLTALHLACGITFDGDIRPLVSFQIHDDYDEDANPLSLSAVSMTKIRSTMIVALLKSGCQPNARTSQGETSLHIILRLLREITDIHPSDSNSSSSAKELDKRLNPLRAELQAIASVLCTYGARLDISDNLNISCSDLAAPLNIINKLEASYSLFIDRQPPTDVSLSGSTASSNPLVAAQRFDQLYTKNHGKVSLPSWKSDNSSNNCLLCCTSFTMTRRCHHCRWCGLLVCDACSKKRFPIPRRGDDSDDDENFTTTTRASLPSSGTNDKKNTNNVFGSLFSALSLSTDNNSTANDIDRVCDGCFNSLCTLAEISTEETQKWEQEKSQALQKSRNMVNNDKQDKITMDRIKNKINEVKLTPDQERSALFARGSGSTTNTSSVSSSSSSVSMKKVDSLQNTMNDNKNKLIERGEKLSRLDEKMRDMNAAAADFSNMASQLKKKSKGGWFF